ncbi:MAG: hypothetical protein V4543_13235 [Bacteroidota bacterium]
MKKLSRNWITEGLNDFEYKKYVLLAYLQEIGLHFGENRLYPGLSDLVFHYNNLVSVRDSRQLMHDAFPKEVSGADFERMNLIYRELVKDDDFIRDIEEIILFSLPRMEKYLQDGMELYRRVEENLSIAPVGLISLYPAEGYVMLVVPNDRETRIFEYQISVFENANERYRGLHLEFLESVRRSPANTPENLKSELIRRRKKLPNPATYLVESSIAAPLDETLLPVVKRSLVKYIGNFSIK